MIIKISHFVLCCIIGFVASFNTAYANFFGNFVGESLEPRISNSQLDNIRTVQNGLLPQYSRSITVGSALNNYYDCFSDTKHWEYFITAKGQKIIEYRCKLDQQRNTLKDFAEASILFSEVIAAYDALSVLYGGMLSNTDKCSTKQISIDEIVEISQMELIAQFAINLDDTSSFSHEYLGVKITYPDNMSQTINLPLYYFESLYSDSSLLFPDNVTDEETQEILIALISGRRCAEAED